MDFSYFRKHAKPPSIIEILLSIGFYPNLFQTIILVSLAYLNDKTPILFYFLKKSSKNPMYSNFIVFLCFTILTSVSLFVGYNLDEIIKSRLIDWFCILFFFISGIYYIIQIVINQNKNFSFLDEYNALINQGSNNYLNIKRSLSVIIEESSKFIEDDYTNIPIMESRKSLIADKDIKEATVAQSTFYMFIQDVKNVLCERFFDYTYYVILFLCFVYDSGAVIVGVLFTFFSLLLICIVFDENLLSSIFEDKVKTFLGVLLIIFSVQLYLVKAFDLMEDGFV